MPKQPTAWSKRDLANLRRLVRKCGSQRKTAESLDTYESNIMRWLGGTTPRDAMTLRGSIQWLLSQ